MAEYAFDVKLAAVVRITARSEAGARKAMAAALDACQLTGDFLNGFNQEASKQGIRITEFSLDSRHPNLFEQDGKPTTSAENCRHGDTAGGICLDCGHDTDTDPEET